jgi:hypothetical protein
MSEAVAGKRIATARAARRFPVLFEMVARGELHLSGVQRLAAHLSDENHQRVLAAAKHRTTREIEKLVAELAPKPDVASSLRKLPARSRVVAASATLPPQPAPPAASQQPAAPPRAPDPAPLSPRRYKLAVTLDQQTHDQLRQLQDLLAHQIPSGDPAAIVRRALQALLAETQKKKTARTQKPRTPSMPRGTSSRTSRAVPADLKRAVWQHDQGRCGFISKDGHRCGTTRARIRAPAPVGQRWTAQPRQPRSTLSRPQRLGSESRLRGALHAEQTARGRPGAARARGGRSEAASAALYRRTSS